MMRISDGPLEAALLALQVDFAQQLCVPEGSIRTLWPRVLAVLSWRDP